ncbi:alpha/beta hydrolase fold domain-containing protein [Undibacterium pigrum]|uniref:Acetyl esterase/lipase n=1 Tax=Undibacterium pigrum TaxID=401470 RepID=A0A318J9I0_9BURK|nr:alpha/beta hydrolase [Undibacterium pigrum]PXX45002.1 acetyl esterase/lipase [Undibacterium pigrum]
MPVSFPMSVFPRPALPALALCLVVSLALPVASASAGVLRDKIMEKRQERKEQRDAQAAEKNEMSDPETTDLAPQGLPAGTRVLRDIAYGSDKQQTMDIYLPANAASQKNMPVIFMVHGGAWRTGSKTARGVVENKVAHWLPRGYVFISINYRMLPEIKPLEQADDVAKALAAAQTKAAEWGGSRNRFILMGHSAGAHLVSLLASSPAIAAKAGASAWLATVSLDSAAYDISKIMEQKHYRFYDDAFGTDPAYWQAASPSLQLKQLASPFMAVCSSIRPDKPCAQAEVFIHKAKSLGMQAVLLPQSLSHAEINKNLGLDNTYTTAVDNFLKQFDTVLHAGHD